MKRNPDFNVIETMIKVRELLKNSKLNTEKINDIASEINQLNVYFNTTTKETALFIILCECCYNEEEGIAKVSHIANFLDVSIFDLLLYKKELENLKSKKLINIIKDVSESDNKNLPLKNMSFSINPRVSETMANNEFLNLTTTKGKENTKKEITNEEFVKKIADFIEQNENNLAQIILKAKEIEKEWKTLPFLKNAKTHIKSIEERLIFFKLCNDLSEDEWKKDPIPFYDILKNLYSKEECYKIAKNARSKKHSLFVNELIEFTELRDINTLLVTLGKKGWSLFYDKYASIFYTERTEETYTFKEPKTIDAKNLFFSKNLENKVDFLRQSLLEENFLKLQTRLKKEKLKNGVCALFFGPPGTGKTETVYQLAKTTGRTIMHIEISQIFGKYWGETEHALKQIFSNYKKACKQQKPILLFNEADAIFSKRNDVTSSRNGRAQNAIQNIILEELENFDGILIATTNLQNNMDAAYDRRFLFKIEFEKPTLDAKEKIWQNKLNFLSPEESQQLAKSYDFSGGEIDNIAKKCIMQDLLSATKPTFSEVDSFCKENKISDRANQTGIGFCV